MKLAQEIKKILYIHHEGLNSDKANLIQVISMCKAMKLLGHDVILSVPNDKNESNRTYNYSFSIDVRDTVINVRKVNKYLEVNSVVKVVKKNNPDIIYLRDPLLLRHVLNLNIPILYEMHNNKLHNRIKLLDLYWKSQILKALREGKILRLICISQALSDYWISEGVPEDKIVTAHDGIDDDMFGQLLSKTEARAKLKLPTNHKIITYVGSLYKDRNIEDIIQLAEKIPNALFIVVGGPELNKEYYRLEAENSGISNISFVGKVDHIKVTDYLSASDILLALWSPKVPTINFCSPLKIFEYMASERVIVAHGFRTIKEVLTDGESAYLVEPNSFDSLYKTTIKAMQESENPDIAICAKSIVFNKYTWKIRAKNIIDFL